MLASAKPRNKMLLSSLLYIDDIEMRMKYFAKFIYEIREQLDEIGLEQLSIIYPEKYLGFNYIDTIKEMMKQQISVL